MGGLLSVVHPNLREAYAADTGASAVYLQRVGKLRVSAGALYYFV